MKFNTYLPIQKQFAISGYVGPHVLRNLCINIMNEEDCDYYVESVFKLYGERKKGMHVCLHVPNFYIISCLLKKILKIFCIGWAAKLLGFREVILATESIPYLNQPDKVLR